jgi:carbon monoxide dehydrogenase subunit G
MTSVTAALDVDAPADRVWAALTDWVGQSAWMPLTAVEVVAGDGGLGTRLSARTGLGPLGFVDPMTIDVWDPPHRCEVQHHGRVVRGRGIFIVEPLGATRSRVIWTEEVEGALARATAPVTRPALLFALRRFARTVR